MKSIVLHWLAAFICLGFLPTLLQADDRAETKISAEQARFFENKIRPVLVRECYSCHSSEVGQVRGGLWLDTAESTRSGGDSGAAVVPGNLDESLIWNAINHVDFVMPPRKKLSAEILADFRTWIEMGAPDPRTTEATEIKPGISDDDIIKGRQFWSFKQPTLVTVPQTGSDWARTSVDRFVADKLGAHGLKPSPDADATTMLRRLTFDLVGIPPTPMQITQFSSAWKSSPETAIASMADELLATPQFGERWGRHWLDLARYAESTGREVNLSFPYAWRYRDYVIDAFNKDKPYDRFVQEQLAGDLLPAKNDQQWNESLIATGFLALGPKALNEQNGRQFELDLIDEQIDVTTRVMLGTSVACARCHDHKFDPIPQSDYYALSGIFKGMSTHYGTFKTRQNRRPSNLVVMPVKDQNSFDEPLTAKELDELRKELKQKEAELRTALAARRDRGKDKMEETKSAQQRVVQVAQISSAIGLLQAKIDSYDKNGKPLSLCMAVQETTPTNVRLLERGEFNKPAQEIARGFPKVLCEKPVTIPKKSTGRLEFARWVGSEENPLTARVMVNRIWLHLMGNGIVRTPEDFGSTGQPPTHPELLDFLALQFMEQGWSVKQAIRNIVNSRTYRMSSQFDQSMFEADPENRYLWRMEPKRLEAEAIRDSMLAISGELDLSRPHGSIVAQAGTALIREGTLFSMVNKPKEDESTADRIKGRVATGLIGMSGADGPLRASVESLDQPVSYRSVYLPVVRDNIPRALDVFDFAESTMVIGQRETSNTPDQGLFFMNSPFAIDRALAMAKLLQKKYSSSDEQIAQAFQMAYGREATASEISAAKQFYRDYETTSNRGRNRRQFAAQNTRGPTSSAISNESPETQKLAVICQSIMGSAEFRFVN